MASPKQIPRRRKSRVDQDDPVYELDVVLRWIKPPIWRSIAVPSDWTLGHLHMVIQLVMPWEEAHLHCFETRQGRRYAPPPPPDDPFGADLHDLDEADATLADLFEPLKEQIAYEYDFGDSWIHLIKLIDTHPAEKFESVPQCLDGARACPPEDCGSVPGYEQLIEVMNKPDHPEREELIEWMGGEFNPEAFDRQAINQSLARVFGSGAKRRGG